MSLEICYEAEESLELPYEEIAERVVNACLTAENCPFEAEVSLSFVDEEEIRELNRDYREIDRETDVLSFPMLEFEAPAVFPEEIGEEDINPDTGEVPLGDIVINVRRVKTWKREERISLPEVRNRNPVDFWRRVPFMPHPASFQV